jgi:hypothetical protein
MEALLIAIITGILLLMFILSCVFGVMMLGTLAGIGLIIFSFVFASVNFWLFLVLIVAGLTMFAFSIFN